jgi:hypothetical protein
LSALYSIFSTFHSGPKFNNLSKNISVIFF